MRDGGDHFARENLRILEGFVDRTHGAARDARRPQFLDERTERERRDGRGNDLAQFVICLDATGVGREARLGGGPCQTDRAAECLPLAVVADGQDQHAVSGIERVVGRDRRVTVAGA